MDPESKKLLEENLALTKENNNMLRHIRRVQRWGTIWLALKVVIIVGIALGSFYFLEPYINKIKDTWGFMNGVEQQENSTSVQDFLDKFNN